MKEVRIGFIGCGGNAKGHMRRLKEMEGARVVAVCDLDRNRAEEAANELGCDAYDNHPSLLERADLDAVYLSVPVFAHGSLELDVIDRGVPFFVEKPVALNLETALRIQEALEKSGVPTCVGYQLRYLPHTWAVQEWLADRTIGLVAGKYWCGTGRRNDWVTDASRSGGQLVEQATHTLDMMRVLVGEVDEVFSYQAKRTLTENNSNDAYSVALQFESGAIGSFSSTWAWDPEKWNHANQITIFSGDYMLEWSGGGARVEPVDPSFDPPSDSGPSLDEIFVTAVRSGEYSAIRSTYSEAVKTLALTLAANLSAERGKPVHPRDLI